MEPEGSPTPRQYGRRSVRTRRRPSETPRSRGGRANHGRDRGLPPWLTLVGSILFLAVAFAFIFFVAKGCVATQESTQIRKYVTSADSLLGESSNVGNNDLQTILAEADGNPQKLDGNALAGAASQTERSYQQALEYDEVPPEFEEAQPYLVSALGIRAAATRNVAEAASGGMGSFGEALSSAVEDYRLSDSIIRNHFVPESRNALERVGQQGDQSRLGEPEPFMDYEKLGFDAPSASAGDDPNALHAVQVAGVRVAGKPLRPARDVVLRGSAEPIFTVRVVNGGEVAETGVPVEVVMDTAAERQARSATIRQIKPNGGSAVVRVSGFRPGGLRESAEVTVKAGPVEYEESRKNNTLTGTVTFGL